LAIPSSAAEPVEKLAHALAQPGRRVPLIRWTHGTVNRLIMLADACVLVLGAALPWHPTAEATLTRGQSLVIGLIAAACFVATLRRVRSYRVERYRQIGPVGLDILGGACVAALCCSLVLTAFVPHLVIGTWLLSWGVLLLAMMSASRVLAAFCVGQVMRMGLLRTKVAIVGCNALALSLHHRLTAPEMGERYQMVGVFYDPDEPTQTAGTATNAGTLADLGAYAQSRPVDLIVVCLPWQSTERVHHIIDQVQWIAADVVLPIEAADSRLPTAQIANVGGLDMLQIMNRPFKGTQGLMKIAEDYLVGVAALICFSPIMVLAALAVRLDSPGPILFRQARTGFNNKTFMIFKFRTMTVDPDDDGSVGTRGRSDPRITKVGKILRNLSIDELPQLLNVLTGDMSIVGPRPYVPNMLVGETLFNDSVRQFAARHRIKPGITGWAQANGLRGHAVRTIEGARRSVELDIYYITHWNLWFDIRIMMRTIMVLAGRNVY
jgi:putative colanic acid biosynthesis UDP-glucose lipid carrier transferase